MKIEKNTMGLSNINMHHGVLLILTYSDLWTNIRNATSTTTQVVYTRYDVEVGRIGQPSRSASDLGKRFSISFKDCLLKTVF